MLKSKLKEYNPITPSMRHTVLVNKTKLWRGDPFGPLTIGVKKTGGRNNRGRITTSPRGGGSKKKYRIIDFKRSSASVAQGVVKRIEYDPNRTGFIALLEHPNNTYSYILASQNLKVGDTVNSSVIPIHLANTIDRDRPKDIPSKAGNTFLLDQIPQGTYIHNVETTPGKGGSLARSAGTCAYLIKKEMTTAVIRSPSGEYIRLSLLCSATLGKVSNEMQKNISLGKAGRSRWMGIRPSVRGTAQNSVDHPHGGGRGKSKGGRAPVTPWGRITKGQPTVKRTKLKLS